MLLSDFLFLSLRTLTLDCTRRQRPAELRQRPAELYDGDLRSCNIGGVESVADASTGGDAGPMKTTGEVFLHLRRSAATEMEDSLST